MSLQMATLDSHVPSNDSSIYDDAIVPNAIYEVTPPGSGPFLSVASAARRTTTFKAVRESLARASFIYAIGTVHACGPEDADISLFAAPDTWGESAEDSQILEGIQNRPQSLGEQIGGWILFFGALAGFVVLNVCDLICRQLALNNGERAYSIYAVLIMSNAISIIISNTITYSKEGLVGIKQAWDWRYMLRFAVPSVCFNCMSLLKFLAIDFGMQSDMIMLINRLSIPVLAFVMYWALKRGQSKIQWALLITVTMAVILFVRLKDGLKSPSHNLGSFVCANQAYTNSSASNCNGWQDLTLSQCESMCIEGTRAQNCPKLECTHLVHDKHDGRCNLYDKCVHKRKASSSVQLFRIDAGKGLGLSHRDIVAAMAAVGAMLCDVAGATTESAVYTWSDPRPLYIQKNHLDFPGMLAFIICMFVIPFERARVSTEGFFGGWNVWVVIVSLLFIAKMWCSSYIVKVLGPVVKQVASIAGMVLSYFAVMFVFPGHPENKFDLNVFLCVLVVALCVGDYAVASKKPKKESPT